MYATEGILPVTDQPFVHRGVLVAISLIAVAVMLAVSMVWAARASADVADTLREAVTAARAGAACAPLQPDPLVQRSSEIVLHSTDSYLNHDARTVPVEDPSLLQSILKDLGYQTTKVKILQGAGRTEADAIEFILISGYQTIPDCDYSDFGAAITRNDTSGYFLTAVVLAGARQ